MSFSRALSGIACAMLLAFLPCSVQAQDQTTAPKAETQQVGDWTIRCLPTKSPSPCDMMQQFNDKNTRQMVLSLSIAYIPGSDRYLMQIIVPLGVAVTKGAIIQTSIFTSSPFPYRRCDRMGCYVELVIDNNSIDNLARAGEAAAVKVVAYPTRPFDLRFSLKGFGSARDTMVSLAKQKASKPDEAAAPAK